MPTKKIKEKLGKHDEEERQKCKRQKWRKKEI